MRIYLSACGQDTDEDLDNIQYAVTVIDIWNSIKWKSMKPPRYKQSETFYEKPLKYIPVLARHASLSLCVRPFPQDAPVKLCDFGFAKIDQGDLMTPQFTPYYVAPQVKSKHGT